MMIAVAQSFAWKSKSNFFFANPRSLLDPWNSSAQRAIGRVLTATLILFLFFKNISLIFTSFFPALLLHKPGTLSYFLYLCISFSYQKHSLNHTRISMLRPSMVVDFYAISMIFNFSQQKFSFVLKYQQIHIKRFLTISHFTFFHSPFRIFLIQISHENRRRNPRDCAIRGGN